MKRLLCLTCALMICLGLLAGCKDKDTDTPDASEPAGADGSTLLTEDICRSMVADAYPEGVAVTFEKLEDIGEKTCIVFYVNRDSDGLMVGRAAVAATDGEMWFWDMTASEQNTADAGGWVSSQAFVFGDALTETALPKPYFELSELSDLTGEADALYFAHLSDFPELLPNNQGMAYWRAADNSLEIVITVVLGSVDGQPAGPELTYLVQWGDNGPEVALKATLAAPMFTSPAEAINSAAEAEMEDDQIIALATYLRDKIDELKA